MFCRNCGKEVNSGDVFCNNCGATIEGNFNNINSNSIDSNKVFKSTGILVCSIIQILCMPFITGVIALVLFFSSFRPAVKRNDVQMASEAKKNIKMVLEIGFIIDGIIIFLSLLLVLIPNLNRV